MRTTNRTVVARRTGIPLANVAIGGGRGWHRRPSVGGKVRAVHPGAGEKMGNLDEVGAVSQPIERRGGEERLAEEFRPFRSIPVAGERDGPLLVSVR